MFCLSCLDSLVLSILLRLFGFVYPVYALWFFSILFMSYGFGYPVERQNQRAKTG
jgi:hypothetical protein